MIDDLIPDWREHARCAGSDYEPFFPKRGDSTARAKAICRECPVSTECLIDAIERNEPFGVRGGMAWGPRKALVREMSRTRIENLAEYIQDAISEHLNQATPRDTQQ